MLCLNRFGDGVPRCVFCRYSRLEHVVRRQLAPELARVGEISTDFIDATHEHWIEGLLRLLARQMGGNLFSDNHPVRRIASSGNVPERQLARLPDARDLKARLEPRRREFPGDVPVTLTALARFDALLEARA